MLTEKNLADLIRIYPMKEPWFDVENERYRLPIFAALATGSHEAVRAFLEVQAEIQLQEPPLRYLCEQYSENRDKRINLGRNFAFSRQRSVSSYIGERSNEIIIFFLYTLGKLNIKSKDGLSNRTLLPWAEGKGHEAVVKLQLEKGTVVESKDKYSNTLLWWAMWNEREAVIKLLLEKGTQDHNNS